MKTHTLEKHKSWNKLGKYYWFLIDAINDTRCCFYSTTARETIEEMKSVAEKIFTNYNFHFVVSKTGYEIIATARKK